jgi:hypothetical protein
VINYDGRLFRPVTEAAGETPVARYHQEQDLVWGEFSGGGVRHGSLTGTCDQAGVLRFAYCMVLAGGEVISGFCRSVPQVLADGRIRLTEYWERFGAGASAGVSALEELGGARDVGTALVG